MKLLMNWALPIALGVMPVAAAAAAVTPAERAAIVASATQAAARELKLDAARLRLISSSVVWVSLIRSKPKVTRPFV